MAFQMSFPILGIDQLVMAFSDIGMNITENDFKNPKREVWELKFAEMISVATGCSQESLFQVHLASSDQLSYPELHENAIPLFHISKAMCRVLYTCGVSDFKITDITEPKPKRLVRFCSAVINFLRFQEDRFKTYEQIKLENEAAAEHSKILTKENEDLCRQINAIKAARAEKETEIQSLDDAIFAMTATMQKFQDLAAERQKDCATTKHNIAEKRAHLAKLKEDLARYKEEGNKLSGLIVQSPERMKGEMERMQQKLTSLKYDKDERLGRLMEYKKKKEMLQSKMNDSEQALKLITAINEQIQREKTVSTEIDRIKDSIQTKKDHLRELELKEQTLRRMLQSKQDRSAKVNLQQQGKLNSMKENLDHISREKETLEAMNSQEENDVSQIQEQIKNVLQEQAEFRKQTQQLVNDVSNKYSCILEQVDSYHKRLGEAWEALKPELVARLQNPSVK